MVTQVFCRDWSLCPCCHGTVSQPGQSGRRWVSEPLLLKPKQDAWPMGRVAKWSHHGNLSPEVPTRFSLFARGRLGFLQFFSFKEHLASQGGHLGVTAGVYNRHLQRIRKDPASDAPLIIVPPQVLSVTCVYDLRPSP